MKRLILLSLLLCILQTNMLGQGPVQKISKVQVRPPESITKRYQKNTSALISVAYSDLYGESIPPNILRQLSQSFEAIGDRKLALYMVLCYLLEEPDGQKTPSIKGLIYLPADEILKSTEPSDNALELCYLVQTYFVMMGNFNKVAGMENFMEWRQATAPNMPSGIQKQPSSLEASNLIRAFRSETEEWQSKHPDEFKATRSFFRSQMMETWYSLGGKDYQDLRAYIFPRFRNNLPLLPKPLAVETEREAIEADLDQFVRNCYQNFLNREPNPYEAWQLKEALENDPEMSPRIVYLSIMQSEEYSYY